MILLKMEMYLVYFPWWVVDKMNKDCIFDLNFKIWFENQTTDKTMSFGEQKMNLLKLCFVEN